jgi:hypothetical protein
MNPEKEILNYSVFKEQFRLIVLDEAYSDLTRSNFNMSLLEKST